MKNIKLLDCTLRDGGYVNDWRFGESTIKALAKGIVQANVDIVELGFLKNEYYDADRTVFNDVKQLMDIIGVKNGHTLYATMTEVLNPLPIDHIAPYTNDGIDIIRVIVWKTKHINGINSPRVDALSEGFEYCKALTKLGYKVCVQPARTDQYSKKEFIEMLEMFSEIKPYAIYIVDSWGTQASSSIMKYVQLADAVLDEDIAIGFHGHNNLMQAFGVTQEFLKLETKRLLLVDSSIYGMGRGAGNLNSEIIGTYLNRHYNKKYDTDIMASLYQKYIQEINRQYGWGYSIPYYLTGVYNCNPRFAEYYGKQHMISVEDMEKIYKNLNDDERTMFDPVMADKYIEMYL